MHQFSIANVPSRTTDLDRFQQNIFHDPITNKYRPFVVANIASCAYICGCGLCLCASVFRLNTSDIHKYPLLCFFSFMAYPFDYFVFVLFVCSTSSRQSIFFSVCFFFPRFHSVNISSEHFFSICLFFTSHILRMLLSGLRLIDLDQNWSNNWLATSIPINLFCVSGCGHTLHGRLTQGPIRVPISIYFGGYICYLSVNLQAIFNLFCTRSWNKTKSAYQFETFRCLSNVSTILQ